jgi:CheY-like chemotaxis protein
MPAKIRKLKVLVANDNMFQLLISSSSIATLPIIGKIDQASNGQEALELVKKSNTDIHYDPYDIILLDLEMPILDGYKACQKIINFY